MRAVPLPAARLGEVAVLNVPVSDRLLDEVRARAHQPLELCYQCHKCAAGCPALEAMEFGPDGVLRRVLLGEAAVLTSRDPWLCTGCCTCAARCPNGLDPGAMMDALRQMAVARGQAAAEPDVQLFHQLFLGVVRHLGRSHEAVTLGLFKLRSRGPLTADLAAGLKLVWRGKVPVLPQRSGARAAVRRLWQRGR